MSSQNTIRPLYDRVVVSPSEAETKTPGGIVIPDSATQEKPAQGTVECVGTGKYNVEGKMMPLQVKKGDKILFGKYAGTNVKLNGKEYLVMREEDIMAVIE